MAEDRGLSEQEAALVFRRAAELEAQSTDDHAEFDAATLVRIGADAGLSPVAIRAALEELRTGRLEPTPAPAEVGVVVVPRRHTVERLVPVEAALAEERLERFLESQVLRICRRRGSLTTWEPSRSLGANIVRGIDLADRMRLSRVDGVELLVEAAADGTFVRVVLDLARMHRNGTSGVIGAGAMGGVGVLLGLGGAAIGAPEALLLVPATTAGAAGTFFGTRSTYAKHVRRAIDAVELVLDELEHGRTTSRSSRRGRRG